ncbi:hypothetical protein KDW_48050 [Dictyobacter vulcani]|uniref:Polyprenyl synthetase n=2 Tax=Dictyobacter vulcani TaxID=2607529 RepID=A0A5J4KSJ6_9CHLR|nr:hypothetical protein KDW_48050 [Dictyobacter vulcani]
MSEIGSIEGAQQFLREMLEDLLPADPLYADAHLALAQPGKILCPHVETHNGLWPLLVWFIAAAHAPAFDAQLVGRGALAMECVVCAFDLYDDIEDEEITPLVAELGSKRVTMAATVLWSLGQRLFLSLHEHMASEVFLTMYTTSTLKIQQSIAGQHLDILASDLAWPEITEDKVLEIARTKSGSLASLACWLGASLGQASADECQLWSELGLRLGAAKQIHNDCSDMEEDWRQHKKTLPLLLSIMLSSEDASEDEEHSTDHEPLEPPAMMAALYGRWGALLRYREEMESINELFQRIETMQASPFLLTLTLLIGLDGAGESTEDE